MQIEEGEKWGKVNGTILAMFARREETQRDLIAFNYLKNNVERMVNRCSPFPLKTKKADRALKVQKRDKKSYHSCKHVWRKYTFGTVKGSSFLEE